MSPEVRILRSDNPEAAQLRAQGWRVIGESWGARLFLDDDVTALRQALARTQGRTLTDAAGTDHTIHIRALTPADAVAYLALERAKAEDYPSGPAVDTPPLDEPTVRTHLGSDTWFFAGAWTDSGHLIAASANFACPDRWEVDRTSVLSGWRGRGLGGAVKAFSLLHLHARGVRCFGTGGAGVNEASLAMNRALGFTIEGIYYSLAPPLD